MFTLSTLTVKRVSMNAVEHVISRLLAHERVRAAPLSEEQVALADLRASRRRRAGFARKGTLTAQAYVVGGAVLTTVLLTILNIFLFKPIRKMLVEREGELSGAKEKVAAVDREVQEKIALYAARLKEVKATASGDREVLKKEAQVEEAAVLDKARKEAADSLAGIKNKVAKEAADAKAILREQANALSLEICEKVLGRSL